MKYKKQVVISALALSLLIGTPYAFASTPKDLGIKNSQSFYQKQNKNNKGLKGVKRHNTVGTILSINNDGFTMEIKNIKAKTTSSVDVKTDIKTIYSKNGIKITVSDLAVGQKAIVTGKIDTTANTITASKVKIVTKPNKPL
ncbi:MAG: hypothetical protein WDK96_02815 [Candidatus Paceibacterota bacterium]|jgi:hypothetical protein